MVIISPIYYQMFYHFSPSSLWEGNKQQRGSKAWQKQPGSATGTLVAQLMAAWGLKSIPAPRQMCFPGQQLERVKRNFQLQEKSPPGDSPMRQPTFLGNGSIPGKDKISWDPKTIALFPTHSPLGIIKHWQNACHLGLNTFHGEELHRPICYITRAKQIFFRQIFYSQKRAYFSTEIICKCRSNSLNCLRGLINAGREGFCLWVSFYAKCKRNSFESKWEDETSCFKLPV